MEITKEFLAGEILSLEIEIGKANDFISRAQATIAAYNMLVNRLEAPEETEQEAKDGDAD
jgi:hypothetical protein